MAVILAVETTTRLCSVALGRDGQLLAQREETSERLTHAERINVFAQEVLAEAGMVLAQVDGFAVGTGPGSYTGSRIGVSAAKGWAFALDRPIMGITTLSTLVQAVKEFDLPGLGATLWPMIDARRMEVFTQEFDGQGTAVGAMLPVVLDLAWAGQGVKVVFGDGADKAVELWRQVQKHITHLPDVIPSARYMLPLAEQRHKAEEFDDLAYLVPAYGKAANVSPPRTR